MKCLNFNDYFRFLYWVSILHFGVCSVFEFLAYEEMKGTTNLAVVDLSPYGFVFKELAHQTLKCERFEYEPVRGYIDYGEICGTIHCFIRQKLKN